MQDKDDKPTSKRSLTISLSLLLDKIFLNFHIVVRGREL